MDQQKKPSNLFYIIQKPYQLTAKFLFIQIS